MNKKIGDYGEDLSKKYLITKGYTILACNYKTKLGEIDIIGSKKETIIFIEVKTRRTNSFGLPREAVNYKKQMVLKKLAQQYIQYKSLKNMNFRFDVIEVIIKNEKYDINHIENAF